MGGVVLAQGKAHVLLAGLSERNVHRQTEAVDILPSDRGGFRHLPGCKAHYQVAGFVDFHRHVVLQLYLVRVDSGVQHVRALGDPVGHRVVVQRDALPQADVAHVTERSGLGLLSLAGPVRLGRDILRPHELDVQGVAASRQVNTIGRKAQHVPAGGELEQLGRPVGHRGRLFDGRVRFRRIAKIVAAVQQPTTLQRLHTQSAEKREVPTAGLIDAMFAFRRFHARPQFLSERY